METTAGKTDHPTYEELKARVDELRLRIHLGGMDAHDKLEALGHDLTTLGREAKRMTKAAAQALRDRVESLEAALIVHD